MTCVHTVFRLLPLFVLALPLLCQAAGPTMFDVIFARRPPLYYAEEGADGAVQTRGVVYERVRAAFAAAAIPVRFVEQPTKRVVASVRDDSQPLCAMGWFKTPEREGFARFSAPIYQDKPWVVVTRKAMHPRLQTYKTLAALLRDGHLVPSILDGISHGNYIDGLLAKARIERATIDPIQNLRKIEASHGDYTILPSDVFDFYRAQNPATTLVALVYRDVEPGEKLYLMCSKSTPDTLIEQFNIALRMQ
ncbi:conserved hypothetical protein [Andreprevotia lacus DSM 23236]|uniref:Uncharacterized protein n=1 Tax=Andreprevotia lacus DSM 23236 TaxID=1121001 RepID=A0A1W1WWT5_9NEIS|nr:transporter substrate-binding domain-containing protein [Andreprevotia lacus]SMC16073.1 conserved hypothetical protein [Andreprevotia lacus DSM 23236]